MRKARLRHHNGVLQGYFQATVAVRRLLIPVLVGYIQREATAAASQ